MTPNNLDAKRNAFHNDTDTKLSAMYNKLNAKTKDIDASNSDH
jgi:hypothetical protein